MMSWLEPIEAALAFVLVGAHDMLTALGLPATSGWTWVLSILCMVVVIRSLLIPLFIYQIRGSRKLQVMQPHMQKIRDKYKNKKDPASKRQMQAEMMELQREHGNPLASCLPMLAQMPIFFALFQLLSSVDDIAAGTHNVIGRMTVPVAEQMTNSSFLGAQLSETFLRTDSMSTKGVAVVLVLLMVASQFYSMRQMMVLNTSQASMDNPMMQNQKILMYVLPVVLGLSGFGFPLGVVFYWFASNLWTTGQQMVVMHYMPNPGSEAERRLNERRAAKGLPPVDHSPKKKKTAKTADSKDADSDEAAEPEASKPVQEGRQRVQPKKTSRRNRNRG